MCVGGGAWESHTLVVTTRNVVRRKSIALKAIIGRRAPERRAKRLGKLSNKSLNESMLIKGRSICAINRAKALREKYVQAAKLASDYSIKLCMPASPAH